jgi:type VI secretion system protein ImpE
VRALRQGRGPQAIDILEEADRVAPETMPAELNGQRIETFRDGDDLFATILEVFWNGGYYWVPLEQIARLATNPPKFPRDLVYLPAQLSTQGGFTGDVYLPTLYLGTHTAADDEAKLGRLTDYDTPDAGPVRGIGAKTYMVEDDETTLLEIRHFVIRPARR